MSGVNLGYSAADLLAYQRQINMTSGAGRALLPLPHHQSMGVSLGQGPHLGAPGSRGVYDSFQLSFRRTKSATYILLRLYLMHLEASGRI
jgi:hypothetical protein